MREPCTAPVAYAAIGVKTLGRQCVDSTRGPRLRDCCLLRNSLGYTLVNR